MPNYTFQLRAEARDSFIAGLFLNVVAQEVTWLRLAATETVRAQGFDDGVLYSPPATRVLAERAVASVAERFGDSEAREDVERMRSALVELLVSDATPAPRPQRPLLTLVK